MRYTRITNPDFWKESHPECNCGSFALGVEQWFAPYGNDGEGHTEGLTMREGWIEDLHDTLTCDEIMAVLLEQDQEEILRQCPWVEPVLPNEIKDDDTIVAYRLSLFIEDGWITDIDEDYHFRLRYNGVWYEKCGDGEIEQCKEQTKEEFNKVWRLPHDLVYTSDIVYFRHKDQTNLTF